MIQEGVETEELTTLRDIFSSATRLSRLLALLEPTKTLARLFADEGASAIETHCCSLPMPHGGFSAHCSREISGAQARKKGDSRDATPVIP